MCKPFKLQATKQLMYRHDTPTNLSETAPWAYNIIPVQCPVLAHIQLQRASTQRENLGKCDLPASKCPSFCKQKPGSSQQISQNPSHTLLSTQSFAHSSHKQHHGLKSHLTFCYQLTRSHIRLTNSTMGSKAISFSFQLTRSHIRLTQTALWAQKPSHSPFSSRARKFVSHKQHHGLVTVLC